MQEEMKKLEDTIASKNNEIRQLKESLYRMESDAIKFQRRKRRIKSIVLELEDYKRYEKKDRIKQLKNKIGEFQLSNQMQSNGKTIQVWVDGQEVRKIKDELRKIDKEKNRIKQYKEGLKNSARKVSKRAMESDTSYDDGYDSDGEEIYNRIINGDAKEAGKQLDNILNTIMRKESELKDKMDEYESEKYSIHLDEKLLFEEVK